MRKFVARSIILVLLVQMIFIGAEAQDFISPIGVWKTIDDKTNEPKALVQISEVDGKLRGVITKIFPNPQDPPKEICENCKGERKDKPILGMTILWDLKREGDEYLGGEILDPKNGKIYRAKMKLIEDGKRLEVRGFIGFALLGRTQTWQREK